MNLAPVACMRKIKVPVGEGCLGSWDSFVLHDTYNKLQSSAIKCNQSQSIAYNCAVADGGLSSARRRKRHDILTFPRSAQSCLVTAQ